MEKLKLSDEVIGHIARLVQLGFLEGTDVVDHFRMMELMVHDSEIVLMPTYEEVHAQQIKDRLEHIQEVVNNTTESGE